MTEDIKQAPQGRTAEGRFGKQESITPLIWAKVELEHPEVIGLYAAVPISLLVEKKLDDERMVTRRSTNLVTLLSQRYGLGVPVERMADMAIPLGLSVAGIHIITEATVKCISEDTGIELPYSRGSGVQAEAQRVRTVVQDYKKLKGYLESSENIPPLEKTIVERFLEGNAPTAIAEALNLEMQFSPGINASQGTVLRILNRVLGRIDYVHPSRLMQRSLKAGAVIEAAVRGDYTNRKAQVSEEILEMLAHGNSREEIIAELGINYRQYHALINEAFLELDATTEGREELDDIYIEVVGDKDRSKPKTVSRKLIAAQLLGPYRLLRQRLGEVVTESGMLSATRLSSRERTILESVAKGAKQAELATTFSTNPGYITEAAYWLLGETQFHSWAERLPERQQVFSRFNTDLQSSTKMPGRLLSIDGIPTTEILEKLAIGQRFSDISREIEESTGKHITEGRLLVHYQKVRGYYKIASDPSPASIK